VLAPYTLFLESTHFYMSLRNMIVERTSAPIPRNSGIRSTTVSVVPVTFAELTASCTVGMAALTIRMTPMMTAMTLPTSPPTRPRPPICPRLLSEELVSCSSLGAKRLSGLNIYVFQLLVYVFLYRFK